MTRGRRAQRQRPAEPHRRCLGCRKVVPQRELLRLAAEDGQAVPGAGKPGRGCWLHRDRKCAELALKTGQIPRALKGKGQAPELGVLLGWLQLTGTETAD